MDQRDAASFRPRAWGEGAGARPLREDSLLGRSALEPNDVLARVRSGHRFIVFPWCISLGLITVKQFSVIHILPPGDGTGRRSARYVVGSLVLGWWGLPWGPIWTISSVWRSLRGGIDVTEAIRAEATYAKGS